jgi:hypothetical protein
MSHYLSAWYHKKTLRTRRAIVPISKTVIRGKNMVTSSCQKSSIIG